MKSISRNFGSIAVFLAIMYFVIELGSASDEDILSIGSVEFTLVNRSANDGLFDFTIMETLTEEVSQFVVQFIPGNLFGYPRPEVLIVEPLDADLKAKLSFDPSIFTGSAVPKTLDMDSAGQSFTIVPADTKFGRIVVIAKNKLDRFFEGKSDLYVEGQGDISIAYFDRAAKLNGTIEFNDERIRNEFNIDIPKEGFYAMGFVSIDDTTLQREASIIRIPKEVFFYVMN